jgi:hypothetical protein
MSRLISPMIDTTPLLILEEGIPGLSGNDLATAFRRMRLPNDLTAIIAKARQADLLGKRKMAHTLVDLARQICAGADAIAKPLKFYAIYDRYFAEFAGKSVTFLELGVHTGESLKVWASYFPNGTVIGLDLAETGPDVSAYPNIVYESADQADCVRLETICKTHAPDGLDLIIDDASHIGHSCATSYAVLFPHLKPGGLYIIEDWGTGYYDDWPDGGHYQKMKVEAVDGLVPKRLPSHDFGMVGFVKSLIDEVAGDHVRPTLGSALRRTDTMEFMHIYKMFAIIKKL